MKIVFTFLKDYVIEYWMDVISTCVIPVRLGFTKPLPPQ